jgi:transposase InsO family protein
MTRHRSLRVVQCDAGLLPWIQVLKAEHPFWGYRRIWAYLRFVEQLPVNKKRIWRLMRAHRLLVPPNLRLKAKRTPTGRKPKPTQPNQWWGIDMTKALVGGVGWVYIVIVLDWYTKVVVGHYAGLRCTGQQWLEALDTAVNRQFPHGARGQGVSLMSDNGCQPTSTAFMRACATLEIHQAFTSDNDPKGNADTERFMRTLKEECLWLQEWTCPLELVHALKDWLTHYNEYYLHSALGYQSPRQFERNYLNHHSPPFAAA